MVTFSNIFLGLAAVVVVLGAPTLAPVTEVLSDDPDPLPPNVFRRGESDFYLGPDHPLMAARQGGIGPLEKRKTTDYTQNYKTGGLVNFTPHTNGFSVDFNTKKDFVVGVGWKVGSHDPITHNGTLEVTGGLATLCIYGWTRLPLIEYYIIENSVNYQQSGTKKGKVQTDGGSYTIWETVRTNQPSILGTSDFHQFISFRDVGRSSGTVTLANHFSAWANLGMHLGQMDYQVVAVETWNGAGTAKVSVNQRVGGGNNTSSTGGSNNQGASNGGSGSQGTPGGNHGTGSQGGSSQGTSGGNHGTGSQGGSSQGTSKGGTGSQAGTSQGGSSQGTSGGNHGTGSQGGSSQGTSGGNHGTGSQGGSRQGTSGGNHGTGSQGGSSQGTSGGNHGTGSQGGSSQGTSGGNHGTGSQGGSSQGTSGGNHGTGSQGRSSQGTSGGNHGTGSQGGSSQGTSKGGTGSQAGTSQGGGGTGSQASTSQGGGGGTGGCH